MMAKGFIAIDPNKQVRQLTQEGVLNLKRLHQQQRVDGWQYGRAEDLENLISRVVTVTDTAKVLTENEALKAKIAELEKAIQTKSEQPDENQNDAESFEVKKRRTRKSVNTEI